MCLRLFRQPGLWSRAARVVGKSARRTRDVMCWASPATSSLSAAASIKWASLAFNKDTRNPRASCDARGASADASLGPDRAGKSRRRAFGRLNPSGPSCRDCMLCARACKTDRTSNSVHFVPLITDSQRAASAWCTRCSIIGQSQFPAEFHQ